MFRSASAAAQARSSRWLLSLLLLALLALGAVAPPAARAETFRLTYSGAAFGNTATATGTITLDLSQVNNPGDTSLLTTPFVTALTLTVSGASSGNGTFTLADYATTSDEFGNTFFGDIILNTNGGTLDFTRELIGQPTLGLPFGTTPSSGEAGDFNLFSNFSNPAAPAPNGTFFFEISTDGGQGDRMYLTSFRPDGILAVNDSAKGDRKGSLLINVLANDFAAEGDTLTITSVTQGSKGTVVNNGDGTVTYTRNAKAKGNLTDSFTYTISDGNGGTATATVTITMK